MTIGIDIDDTITETTLCALEYLAKYNNNVLDHHNLPDDEYEKFMKLNIEDITINAKLKDNVKNAFEYLNNNGYKIVIITARNNQYTNRVEELTQKYLKTNGLKYDTILFNKEKKGYDAKKIGVDIFIDDKEHVLDDINSYGIECIRITNDKDSKYKNFSSWLDIVNYLKSVVGKVL